MHSNPLFSLVNSGSAVSFHLRLLPKLLLNQAQLLLTCSHSDLKKTDEQARFLGGGVEGSGHPYNSRL